MKHEGSYENLKRTYKRKESNRRDLIGGKESYKKRKDRIRNRNILIGNNISISFKVILERKKEKLKRNKKGSYRRLDI